MLLIGAAVAGIRLAGGSDEEDEPTDNSEDRLVLAVAACNDEDGLDFLELADENQTLVLDTGSEYGSVDATMCVFRELEISRATLESIANTTSMMGAREADDGDFHLEWSYHPDNGLNLVLTVQDKRN